MFTVMVNYRWLCMQSSKDTKGSPRKFVFLQSSSPDVQRVGGGGKTNISLLESSEEWALGSKTSTIKDRTQKFGEKEKGAGRLVETETLGWSILVTGCDSLFKFINFSISTWVFWREKNVYIFMQRD